MHETIASRDLLAFRRQYPRALEGDPSGKAYDASIGLRPELTQGTFAEYQQLIGINGEGVSGSTIPIESSRLDHTQIDYRSFSRLHSAIRMGTSVLIEYRSMSHPEKHQRLIRPHSFIQAGPRWHVRAFCKESDDFRDFNLGRISSIKQDLDLSLPGLVDDRDWNTFVRLRLVPHRGLSALQQKLVRDEYMAGTTAHVFEVRKPMAHYLMQSFRAAVDPLKETPPDFLLMVDESEPLPEGALWRA
ncbi:WYL domain-containing protein [Dyella amyloliquefaciens]|uniref:WYL domain-containing protein n=1 Tax=Dyella amyloliquefaciens TaxID=1770545 RepID=UPI00197AD40A|nr:WYL domain-containing protein [Dyella amyloliquefaciens]